jgi:hypothetical protein
MIKTTMIPEQVNVPYDQLLVGVGTGDNARQMGSQESAEQSYLSAGHGDAPGGQRIFSQVPGSIKAALVGARGAYPIIWVLEIMAAATLPMPQVQFHQTWADQVTRACLDMLCLGTCKEATCSYKHPTTRVMIDPAQAVMAAAKLKMGYAAYVITHGG